MSRGFSININADAVVAHTNRLEKMHRSALPSAVRGALNGAAFDVKKNTMPKSAADAFENRSPNFFKANSRVEMARGFDIRSMKATVGFTESGLSGSNNYAVKDLEQQEYGGTIKRRALIPTDTARGGSNNKLVRPANRLSNINNVVVASRARGKSDREKFVKAAVFAGRGGYVMGEFRGQQILWRINSLERKDRKVWRFKLTPLYSYEQGRNVRVKPTGFMQKASLKSAEKIEEIFIKEAERQIERLRK